MKSCTKCAEVKELNLFPIRKGAADSWCKSCYTASTKKHYQNNKEKIKAYRQTDASREKKSEWDRKSRESNKEKISARKHDWYVENKKEIGAKSKTRYAENSESARARSITWKENNREKHNAECMKRHTAKLQRFPMWARECQDIKFFLEEIYDLAIERTLVTGVPHHVDHIVPLQGKKVSGLHLPWNLQVITASENCSKRNSFTEAV